MLEATSDNRSLSLEFSPAPEVAIAPEPRWGNSRAVFLYLVESGGYVTAKKILKSTPSYDPGSRAKVESIRSALYNLHRMGYAVVKGRHNRKVYRVATLAEFKEKQSGLTGSLVRKMPSASQAAQSSKKVKGELVTKSDAAGLVGKSRTTIHVYIKDGRLPTVGRMIDTADLYKAFPKVKSSNGIKITPQPIDNEVFIMAANKAAQIKASHTAPVAYIKPRQKGKPAKPGYDVYAYCAVIASTSIALMCATVIVSLL